MAHPLLDVLLAAADGRHPPVDGGVTFLPELDDGNRAIVALTGHAFVATTQRPDELLDLGLDGFGAALAPAAVVAIAAGGEIGVNDVVLVTTGVGGDPEVGETDRWRHHPRVAHARKLRSGVRVYGDERGFFTLATGLAGRAELSIELADPGATPGLGRHLLAQARRIVGAGVPLFAAVAPGNARSLRSFLAAGFCPIGSEIIIDRSGLPDPAAPVGGAEAPVSRELSGDTDPGSGAGPFVPDDFEVPTRLETDRFHLEPLGPGHNERDHEAWMSSIDHIRATPGFPDGRWPYEMSAEQNLADLVRHADDFVARAGFTYSVLDGDEVIGCVYLYPTDRDGHDVDALSWVCAGRADLDAELWRTVSAWLDDAWPFRNPWYEPRA